MKNLVKFFIIMTVFCITACTHILEDISNKEQIKAQGRLVMKVGNESRTIMPSIGPDDIKSAVLTANGNEIKSWSGDNIINQIENTDDILLDVGNYDFTMTFSNANGTDILTATTNQEIVPGNNTLHFDMKLIGTGDISIILTWDVASGINKITAGLYDISTNEPLADFGDSELEITISDDETPTPTAIYSPSGVPVGQYIIKFKVYNNPNIQDEKLLNTFPYVIKVAPGTTTSTQITLSKINTQYTITYNLNEGNWADGFTPTEDRNANAKIILPTADHIIRPNFEFDGWYDDDNNKITEIPSDTAQNISVTAKWLQLYTITYNLNGGENNTNNPTSYTVETETITLGIPTKNSSTFLGWYNESGDKITEIKPSETAANITVTASWRTTCTQSDVCEVIASLSGPHDILVTGSMHSNFIAENIKPALNGNQNIKVNLDLRQTTGMNEITRYAFEGMSGLSSVILPDSVTSIGDTAFRNCSNLTSINIPYGVISIETETFKGCVSLTEIIIPDSVTSIAYDAFTDCNAVKTLVTGNGLESLDNLPITSALESITIGDSITEIGAEKFKDFTALTSVTIGSGVTTIDYSAFSGCTGLQIVTIGSGVTSIGSYAFNSCSALTSVTFAEDSQLTAIDESAFYSTGLTEITIPASVTFIGDAAFYNCSNLTSVTIPDNVTSIGIDAFTACNSVKTLVIGNNLTSLNYLPITSALESITIGDSITEIGADTFTDCNAVKTLVIGNNLTSFDNLPITSALESITIGDGITEIGAEKFKDFKNLTSVTIGGGVTKIGTSAFSGCTGLTSVEIPNNVTNISASAFHSCSNLTEFIVSDEHTTYSSSEDRRVLYNKEKTTLFAYPSATGAFTIPDNVTTIGESAFEGCSNLTSVTIPDTVTTIGSSAFNGCSNLASVEIPDTVTTIGNYVFYGCGLRSVTIPDTVTSIGSSAFGFCGSLTSVTIPDGVTTIGIYAFRHCSSLESVTIGNSVTSIGSYAFWYCEKLTSVNYKGTQEQWSQISIGSNGNDALTNVNYNYTE